MMDATSMPLGDHTKWMRMDRPTRFERAVDVLVWLVLYPAARWGVKFYVRRIEPILDRVRGGA